MRADTGADTAPTLPARFVGAWERRELTIDGVPPARIGHAMWVQAGDAFVDVRGPGGFASDTCFAGTTAWDDPYLTWTHVIDRHASGDGVDRGRITLEGDDLVEEGDFIAGASRAYRERWSPASGERTPVVAAVARDGVAVRAGNHAAVVVDQRAAGGGLAAHYFRLRGAVWEVVTAIVERGGAPLIPPLTPGIALADGWHWCMAIDT
jgi:hypothetical protein